VAPSRNSARRRSTSRGSDPFSTWIARNAFLHRASGNGEKVPTVGLCESAVAFGQIGSDRESGAIQLVDCEAAISFGDVGRDRESGPIQLVNKKAVTTLEPLGVGADLIGEVQGLLVDQEFLEIERRGAFLTVQLRK
jgi:hypothetical protein